jgi:diketogulonate reductase-like aldo/keto reductase
VDLWLIHWPPGGAGVDLWRRFLDARDAGRARAVGVSNYDVRQIDELTKETGQTPAVNQIPWSPGQYDPRTVAGHRDRGVALEGYSPFKGSNLRDRVLAGVAQAHGVSVPQVILRWHIQHGIVVIPKSVTPERIAANFDVFGFELTAVEMARVDALGR